MDDGNPIPTPPAPAGRFLRRRSILLPTWRLSLIAVVVIGVPSLLAFLNLYRWLAVTEPVAGSRTLIVEGWIPDDALERAADKAREPGVAAVFCTGIPLDRGTLELPYKTYAEYAAATLGKMGVPGDRIHAVPAGAVATERTRAMAHALADLHRRDPSLFPDKSANLFTSAAHARRSRKIFREEMGSDWNIGVISSPDPGADPARWFLSSKSAKEVFTEVIALTMALVGGN